ncbi:tartrate dehydrogenase [Sphingomonas canadensis]|uniref:Tartrate dehydrogenase n=1 Tax=Sphingomonas canadensis TaxID=1219257 RepID=A0ABW3HAN1_9SPHN|nr:tartrate dehydrogenase [Sphingomonas canadensis]MCW3836212.1 tartrate dehydrogenase [Sphingomonas canadensis]
MGRCYRIATIPGDGIGKEVVPEGIRVLDRAGALFGFSFEWDQLPWSCEYYSVHGEMMPADGLDAIRNHDAIFLGAVGFPGVPDHISLWGLLLPIRRRFEQYVNLRPIRLMPGMNTPLANVAPGSIDFVIVRENTEGEYSDQGSILAEGTAQETVVQHSVFTRRGVDRLLDYGFRLAEKRDGKLCWATKSNGIFVAMPYWDARAELIAGRFPGVETSRYHIDILAAHFVRDPGRFDVVVASNLMGDILSDLGAACTGTIGVAPSANLNPAGEYPSMFEPVHGSAPDIFGRNIANPIGQIWSGAMMLEQLGEAEAARAVMDAIECVMIEGPRTPDMGGRESTQAVGKAIAEAMAGPADAGPAAEYGSEKPAA